MADTIDIASEREQTDTARAIEAARRSAQGPEPTGACLFCAEPVGQGARWCNASCRDDWQQDTRRTR